MYSNKEWTLNFKFKHFWFIIKISPLNVLVFFIFSEEMCIIIVTVLQCACIHDYLLNETFQGSFCMCPVSVHPSDDDYCFVIKLPKDEDISVLIFTFLYYILIYSTIKSFILVKFRKQNIACETSVFPLPSAYRFQWNPPFCYHSNLMESTHQVCRHRNI